MALNQTGIQNALTVSTAAVSLTLPAGQRPSHMILQNGAQPIRWRADGTAPTATAGQLVAANAILEFMNPLVNYQGIIDKFQMIRQGGVDSTVEVAFFSE